MSKQITSEHLCDSENHTTCECGNKTIHEYSWSSNDGLESCPTCMVEWQSQQIQELKKLLYKLSSKNHELTALEIKQMYASMYGIDVSDLDPDTNYSEV